MLTDIVAVEPKQEYQLYLSFEDGVCGEVDASKLIEFSGVFAPLKELSYFQQVQVNPEVGTIVWPKVADLDPDVLYAIITGEALPNFSVG